MDKKSQILQIGKTDELMNHECSVCDFSFNWLVFKNKK